MLAMYLMASVLTVLFEWVGLVKTVLVGIVGVAVVNGLNLYVYNYSVLY